MFGLVGFGKIWREDGVGSKIEVTLASFSDYKHGLTARAGFAAAMTRKRSVGLVPEGGKEVAAGRKVVATSSFTLTGGDKVFQVSQTSTKRPGRHGRGLKPTTGSASRSGKAGKHSRHF